MVIKDNKIAQDSKPKLFLSAASKEATSTSPTSSSSSVWENLEDPESEASSSNTLVKPTKVKVAKIVDFIKKYQKSLEDFAEFLDKSYLDQFKEVAYSKNSVAQHIFKVPAKMQDSTKQCSLDSAAINKLLEAKVIKIDPVVYLANELNSGNISAEYNCECTQEADVTCVDQGDWKFKITERQSWFNFLINLYYDLELPNEEKLHLRLVTLKLENKPVTKQYDYSVPGIRSHHRHKNIEDYHNNCKNKLGVGKYKQGTCNNISQHILASSVLCPEPDAITVHDVQVSDIYKIIEALLASNEAACQDFKKMLFDQQKKFYEAKKELVAASYNLAIQYCKQFGDLELCVDPIPEIEVSYCKDKMMVFESLEGSLVMLKATRKAVLGIIQDLKSRLEEEDFKLLLASENLQTNSASASSSNASAARPSLTP